MVNELSLLSAEVWTPAYDAEESPRDGAWVAELTGLLDLRVKSRVVVDEGSHHVIR